MRPVRFHGEAAEELEQAAAYYEERKSGLGNALVTEVESACERIAKYPEMGPPHKRTGLRRLALRRFPFVVYYLMLPEGIWIIAVAHTKRRPDYWKRRRAT